MADLDDGEEGGFDEPTAPAWMATFGDLMSLLLTFFVLLMSFASMDSRKFAATAGSMRDAFGVQKIHAGLIESLSDSVVNLSDSEATPMLRVVDLEMRVQEREQALLERLRRAIEDRELQRVLTAENSPRGVLLRMDESLLFAEGSSELSARAVVFLREVASLIRDVPGTISIEGHTDTSGGSRGSRANWQLSADRSVVVLTHLLETEGLDPSRLQATAFGSTRPLASNLDAEGRALNRRVEFVFLRTEIDLPGNWSSEKLESARGPSKGSLEDKS